MYLLFWSFDGFFEFYHPAWYMFCRSLSLAFPEFALEAQHRNEVALQSTTFRARAEGVFSPFCPSSRSSGIPKVLLARWINSDKIAFREGCVRGCGFFSSLLALLGKLGRRSVVSWLGEGRSVRCAPHLEKTHLMVPLRSHGGQDGAGL